MQADEMKILLWDADLMNEYIIILCRFNEWIYYYLMQVEWMNILLSDIGWMNEYPCLECRWAAVELPLTRGWGCRAAAPPAK